MSRDADDRPNRRYERDEDNLPSAGKSGRSPVLIVLIVVGGLFLVGALACGGVMYLYRRAAEERAADEAVMREAEAAEQARAAEKAREDASDKAVSQRFAESFVKNLKQNRVADAYQQTSPAYQAKTTEPQFAELLRPVTEALAQPVHNPFVEPVDRWGPTAGDKFEFKLIWTAGYAVAFTTVKTPSGWQVDQLSVRKE